MTATAQTDQIEPAAIRAELGRILGSETFSRSERSRELLQYIVERDLEGEADRLKGFAIALDVFDRQDSFDPSTDAVVRVQAGRLRDLLDTYYAGEGAKNDIRITVPRGSYVPAYERICHEQPASGGRVRRVATLVSGGSGARRSARASASGAAQGADREAGGAFAGDSLLVWAARIAIIVLLCGNLGLMLIGNRTVADREPAPAAPSAVADLPPASPSIYLPSVSMVADFDPALHAAFEDAMPRFGSIVYRTDRSPTLDGPLSDFYIRTVPAGTHSHNIQLYHRETGILIGTDQVPGGLDADAMAEHVSRISSRFLPVGGVIYAFLESEGRLNPLTECLVLAAAYFNEQSAERHRAAYDCQQNLLAQDVNSALLHANLASLTVETVTDRYHYPEDVDLEDAIAYGRRAVELAPSSSEAHRSLAWALQVSGEIDAALDEIREGNALNPYDLGIAASYANTLIATGEFAMAVEVLERAVQASPVHPTWWDYALFVSAFQEGRTDLVLASSRNLVGHDRSHYCAARLIAASLDGDDALRKKMLEDARHGKDGFFEDPLSHYSRIMPKAAAVKLVSALRDAGVPISSADDG